MTEAVMISFIGSFQMESFAAFVRHRACRLDLAAVIRHSSPTEIIVEVAGPPDLIGAFEMACSLGPPDALVRDVALRTVERPRPAAPGLVPR